MSHVRVAGRRGLSGEWVGDNYCETDFFGATNCSALSRPGQLSDAETAALVARANAAPSLFDKLASMDTSTKWLLGAVAGVVLYGAVLKR